MFDLSSLFGKATSFLGEVNPAELADNADGATLLGQLGGDGWDESEPDATGIGSLLSEAGLDTASLADGSAFEALTDILGQNRP